MQHSYCYRAYELGGLEWTVDWTTGPVDWTTGMDYWTGALECAQLQFRDKCVVGLAHAQIDICLVCPFHRRLKVGSK